MSMFCFQCQETAKGIGCTVNGVCGKKEDIAVLQDLLVYTAKGIAALAEGKEIKNEVNKFIVDCLFITITNANFDKDAIVQKIQAGLKIRDNLNDGTSRFSDSDVATWSGNYIEEFEKKGAEVGVLASENEDVRSLRELLVYGIKGMAAYAEHAFNLGYEDTAVYNFIRKGLVATMEDLSVDELIRLVMECGKFGVDAMALLDKANTESFGKPEITTVNLGVGKKPGILISGHDLKDMEAILEQTKGTGVDVYTHSEMLPAHYYPAFKKYTHFVGNYGNAWWQQKDEFESFHGPILFTTNCIVPPKKDANYKKKIFTTGAAGLEGAVHISANKNGKKDFSQIIEMAKKCNPPKEIETGEIVGGFAHDTVLSLADKVVSAVKEGAIKKFVVMAGCDGRNKIREYYTDFAKALPQDSIILTAGCAKYRYNKLDLGDIGGIPRVLDAGQCNDSYSLAVIALKLKEVFELDDINELPIAYNIAWYEQKAVIVLLSLLYLGVKNIHLGPTLPAFLSPNVANVLVEKFGIGGISTVNEDMKIMVG